MPENIEYWIKKGMSRLDAKEKANSYSRYAGNPKYYLCRSITDDPVKAQKLADNWMQEKCPTNRKNKIKTRFNGDEVAYNEWNKTQCSLSKSKMLERMSEAEYIESKRTLGLQLSGKRPNDIEYWMNKGYSKKDAKGKVSENAINHSTRRVEYWMNKGYSMQESIVKVSEIQNNTSLESFVSKYGNHIGTLKYEAFRYGQKIKSKRSYLYWINLGYSESDAVNKVSEIQSEYAKLQPKCIPYWINLGYSESDAINKSNEFSRLLSIWCVEYWLDKGYDIEDATKIISDIQKENSLLSLKSYKTNSRIPKSKLEINVIDVLSELGEEVIVDYVINDVKNRTVYFPDIVIKDKCIIEIYGDYWHGNPKIYESTDKIRGITVSEKQDRDANRISNIKQITKLPVYVWWESDINKFGAIELYNRINK